jgi:hypothetical protein
MKLKISKIQDMYHRLFHNQQDSIDFSEHIEFIGSVCFDPKIENKKIRNVSVRRGHDDEYYLEIPESHLQSTYNMRTVKELLDAHVSIYAANKALGMGKSINKLKDWANNGAIVDDNGQPYIKSGKPIEGWKL